MPNCRRMSEANSRATLLGAGAVQRADIGLRNQLGGGGTWLPHAVQPTEKGYAFALRRRVAERELVRIDGRLGQSVMAKPLGLEGCLKSDGCCRI